MSLSEIFVRSVERPLDNKISYNGEGVPPVPDLNTTILQAIQGMMDVMMEDRQERRAQQQRQERTLQEVEGLVVQERQVDGRWRGRNNHATIMQPRRMERVHEDRMGELNSKSRPFVERQILRHTCSGKER